MTSPPAYWFRTAIRRTKTKALRRLRYGVAPSQPGASANHELVNITIPAEVVVYFPDDLRKFYQLEQWLPVLAVLDQSHSTLLITRNVHVARELRKRTPLRVLYVRRFTDLMDLYRRGDYKAAIYVNNGVSNFQSLAAPRMVHIHVNHGESDKTCNVSNQVKAYDKIFVAGDAAVARHRAALINHDLDKLVKVGRPQLDVAAPTVLTASTRRTLLYAPTWEGEDDANNYTSLDIYGPRIVQALVDVPDSRVVYRPHPRITVSKNPEIRAAHAQVRELLAIARTDDPSAGHTETLDGSTLSLFARCDLLVTDMSSVGLDFLYRHADKPIFITDRRDNREQLLEDSPMAGGADIVDTTTLPELTTTATERLSQDALREERTRLREYYFGDLDVGESTRRFLDAVKDSISERDQLLTGPHIVSATA